MVNQYLARYSKKPQSTKEDPLDISNHYCFHANTDAEAKRHIRILNASIDAIVSKHRNP